MAIPDLLLTTDILISLMLEENPALKWVPEIEELEEEIKLS